MSIYLLDTTLEELNAYRIEIIGSEGCSGDEEQFQQIERYLLANPTLKADAIFRINGRITNTASDQ